MLDVLAGSVLAKGAAARVEPDVKVCEERASRDNLSFSKIGYVLA
jgi:hypothetical protein